MQDHFGSEDFTIKRYEEILDSIEAEGFVSSLFTAPASGKHILLRHDIDMSVHRAVKMARLEAKRGFRSTYFFQLNSAFYNIAEQEVRSMCQEIIQMGHGAGLHFDMESVQGKGPDSVSGAISKQADILNYYLDTSISALSFHNPDLNNAIQFNDALICGMVNTYGEKLRMNYEYVSDSNGIWRHRSIFDVLKNPQKQHIHALLHPVWWQDSFMPPRDRITRAIEGRAKNLHDAYDDVLRRSNRPNIRS